MTGWKPDQLPSPIDAPAASLTATQDSRRARILLHPRSNAAKRSRSASDSDASSRASSISRTSPPASAATLAPCPAFAADPPGVNGDAPAGPFCGPTALDSAARELETGDSLRKSTGCSSPGIAMQSRPEGTFLGSIGNARWHSSSARMMFMMVALSSASASTNQACSDRIIPRESPAIATVYVFPLKFTRTSSPSTATWDGVGFSIGGAADQVSGALRPEPRQSL